MSIPKCTTSWFGRYDDPEKLRLIPQEGVRIRVNAGGTGYPSCWDMNVSPYDGDLYYAPCDETGRGAHTRLVRYNWESDSARVVVKAEELVLPRERHMPHSKFHESITFLPNGHVVMSTHSTDRGKFQPEWMPFAHVDHVWDGFPGSYVIEYDPVTGRSWNHGMPAPRESIYGMTYDPKYNALYMIGFMRGHVYRLSLDDKSVKDLGKAAEVFCYRLHCAPDGHIYGMTKSGFLWRVNVDTQQLEDLNWRLPATRWSYVADTWYRYMAQAHNVSDHEFVFCGCSQDNFYLYDCSTGKVRDLGPKMPCEFENDIEMANFSNNEFGVDRDGVLWYTQKPERYHNPSDEYYKIPRVLLLCRFDYKNGKPAEVVGILGTQDQALVQETCSCLDAARDRFFIIGQILKFGKPDARSEQGLFMLDLTKTREALKKGRGPVWVRDLKSEIVPMNETEVAAAKKKALNYNKYAGEEVAEKNPVTAFPISDVIPIRLWRQLAGGHIEDSKVSGIAWDDLGNLHGVCGENGERKYYFKISPASDMLFRDKAEADNCETVWMYRMIRKFDLSERQTEQGYAVTPPDAFSYKVETFIPYEKITVGQEKWLNANLFPKAYDVDKDLTLPEIAGRRYLAKASACIDFSDNRQIIGTKDGLLCIAKYGNIFNLGNAAPLGPVRCLCTNADGTILYGTAGDEEDMGTVFTFDDRSGLRQLGVISYNSHGWMDGPTAAHILTCCALSPDGKYLAVGNADRLGCVHLFRL